MSSLKAINAARLLLLALSFRSLHAAPDTAAEALTKACRLGDLKTAENLLSSGANPDRPDQYGHTPLYYAASFNQTKAIQLLLSYHADPNAPNTDSSAHPDNLKIGSQTPSTPLQYAAYLGNVRTAEILIGAGARLDTRTAARATALHFSVMRLDMLHLLLEKGADVNVRDAEGVSPLDDAVWFGSLDAVAILLANGARLDEIEPKTGATPINEAAYRGHVSLVRYLLRFNPDLEIRDKHGSTPLENAIHAGKDDCAVLLLEAQAKQPPTQQAFDKAFLQKTMDSAARRNEPLVVEALLRHGAVVNDTLPSGSTALDAAAFTGSLNVVNLLLTNGADPNITTTNGGSPLVDACLKGYESVAATLIDHGALVNQINPGSGETALHAAAAFGRAGVVKVLLAHGANPNSCGKSRKSPYQVALENGYEAVANQMQAHGGTKTCR